MAGTTGLEPATSAVTGEHSTAGRHGINKLDVRLSATTGFIGQGWLAFVQPFVQPTPRETIKEEATISLDGARAA